jgi:hypothetical protein
VGEEVREMERVAVFRASDGTIWKVELHDTEQGYGYGVEFDVYDEEPGEEEER